MSQSSGGTVATSVAPEVDFNHHSPEYADAWPEITRELRAKCPVTHTSAWGGFYVVTGYDELGRVIRDDATFSSARAVAGLDPETLVGITIPPAPNGSCPIDLDPPYQKPYRRLLDPVFSPKASAAWEPFLRDAVTACIDGFIESGRGDIVLDIANPIPALLTCKLMGLPLEDWRYYAEPMHEAVYTPPGTPESDAVHQKVNVMLAKIMEAVAARRTDPRDDLITRLVQAEIDGAPISDEVMIEILFLVLVGGVDTTTSLMANSLRWLSQHPEHRERLREDPSLLPKAREEMLRFFTPTQGLSRTVTGDTEVAGVPLSLGDRVFMSFAAANRDPEAFPDPDEMVLDRSPNPHTTFGLGVHRCLGSNIARVEFDVVITEVLRRLPDYVVDETGSKRYETVGVVNGWERMPMTFAPGTREGSSLTEALGVSG
jgi:cytochrome P450